MGELFKSTVFHKSPLFLLLIPLVTGGIVKRADDFSPDLQAMQTVMQQQASAISALQAKMAAVEGKVESLSKSGK
jgi:hypothetical protein